jgi:hypothetical protein
LNHLSEFFSSVVDYFSDAFGSSNPSAHAPNDFEVGQIDADGHSCSALHADPSAVTAQMEPNSVSSTDFYDFSACGTTTPFQIACDSGSVTASAETTQMFGSFDSGTCGTSSWDSGSSCGSSSSFDSWT